MTPYYDIMILIINLFDIESKTSSHKEWQLNQEHVPAEVVQAVGDAQGPEGYRSQDGFPGYGRLGVLEIKSKHLTFTLMTMTASFIPSSNVRPGVRLQCQSNQRG